MPIFSPQFLDELRARTPLASLIGRRVKLTRAGRQWKACCPFHGEKSPSFYVYEDHFHCFGCGAHGDAVAFVMQSQGAGFPEAVEQLAAEAGLDLPRPADDGAVIEQASREQRLHAVLEAAADLFHAWLGEADGRAARRYLENRGIASATIDAFRLGWSGDGNRLRPALTRAGFDQEMQRDAGLLHVGEDGAIRGEMFRSRIIFPIADKRGRTVGFGGRTMGDGQPKYLNGPETPVFSKRRLLYGHDRARAAIRAPVARGAVRPRLVIAEGYMDVIALFEAGIPAAVAPLGTALTEEQLDAAWGLDAAPTICLDGDAAGRNAARRAIERALPRLAPERTLLIASLDAGEDPDSLYRRHGSAVLTARLGAARPLSDALYDLLDPPGPDATPEARAAFLRRLLDAASRVGDRTLASEYRRTFRERFYQSTRARDRRPRSREVRPILSDDTSREERACLLAITALHNPSVLRDVEDAWHRVDLPPWLAQLRSAILQMAHSNEAPGSPEPEAVLDSPEPEAVLDSPEPEAVLDSNEPEAALDSNRAVDHLGLSGCEEHLRRALDIVRRHGGLPPFALPGAMPAEAEQGWWHFFGLMQHAKLDEEIAMARSLLTREFTDRRVMRVTALVEAREKLRAVENDARV